MTDDDLRVAADRVRRAMAGEHPYAIYGQDDAVTQGWYDRKILAEAWVAEHPADDAEPVSVEWLKACGFLNEDDDEPTFWTVTFSDMTPAFTIDVNQQSDTHAGWIGEAEDYISWPHDIVSRGQVRDICRALGITLKGPK